MAKSDVTQSNNIVGGDVAAGNINKNRTSLNFGRTTEHVSPMSHLLAKFEEELKNNSRLSEFIDELEDYNSKVDGDVAGLEQKLKDGGRDHWLGYALRAKEGFHKKLFKFQFSESAQKINLHLLAHVESTFVNEILPRILDGVTDQEVGVLIQERLINPLMAELEENTLGFTDRDINGMLYFLTGNCHIKWTA